jgi:hypothetical protein
MYYTVAKRLPTTTGPLLHKMHPQPLLWPQQQQLLLLPPYLIPPDARRRLATPVPVAC